MSRSDRRHHARRVRARWERFLRALDVGHSWRPFRDMDPAHWKRFVARLASGTTGWTGSDKGWKLHLRRQRKAREADAFRMELCQSAAAVAEPRGAVNPRGDPEEAEGER